MPDLHRGWPVSITAGLVLIYLIIVMLPAERKSEMGMARAVGAQRGHLVEMFVFEGTAYDLAAAAVGVALGVATGLILALTLGRAFTDVGLSIRPSVSPRSLLVSYSLGMLVTFATVLVSAYRVSHLNIVSAIRDLPEPPRPPSYARDRLLAPLRAVVDGFRWLFRLRPLRALRAWLIGVPDSLLRLAWGDAAQYSVTIQNQGFSAEKVRIGGLLALSRWMQPGEFHVGLAPHHVYTYTLKVRPPAGLAGKTYPFEISAIGENDRKNYFSDEALVSIE